MHWHTHNKKDLRHIVRHCVIHTAGGGVCYLVNIIIQKASKEVRVCEVA